MIEITLQDDAFDELRNAAGETGQLVEYSQYGELDRDSFSVGGAIYRRYIYIPTAEDIERRKEFEATPLGQTVKQLYNRLAAHQIEELLRPNPLLEILSDEKSNWQWPDTVFPTTLRIRLPK